jgi:hypothetical protein
MQTGWRIELHGALSISLNDTYRDTGTVATTSTVNFGAAKNVACVSINQSTPATRLSAGETWRITTTNFLPFGSHEILWCSQWVESVIGTEADLGEQCCGVWYQGDHRNYRITCTHYMINEQYSMFSLSCFTGWLKNMDSILYFYNSWTIQDIWMIYITFERGSPKFSNNTARALA